MARHDSFDRIVGEFNDAMLDDARWPAASALIDEACGAKGNMLVFGDGATQEDVDIFFARFCYRGERRGDLERAYFSDYYAQDERVPRLRRLPDSAVVHVSSLYTEDERKTSPVYNEALPFAHTQDGLNVRLDGPDGSRIVWAIADPVDAEGWSSARVEMIRRLLPCLRQYVRVRSAVGEARLLGASVTQLLDATRVGIIQLDRRGRILEANDRAGALLRANDGLSDQGGAFHAVRAEDDEGLQGLLVRALPRLDRQGESGSMLVRRSSSLPKLALHVKPVADGEVDHRPRQVAALVLIVDPAGRGRIEPDVVETMLGLTPAEAEIATLLAEGRTLHEIARATGRGYNTVRTHLRHMFEKLGSSRQFEVAQAVLSLSSLPKSRDEG